MGETETELKALLAELYPQVTWTVFEWDWDVETTGAMAKPSGQAVATSHVHPQVVADVGVDVAARMIGSQVYDALLRSIAERDAAAHV